MYMGLGPSLARGQSTHPQEKGLFYSCPQPLTTSSSSVGGGASRALPLPRWALDWFDLVLTTTGECQGTKSRSSVSQHPSRLLVSYILPCPFSLVFSESFRGLGLDVPLGLSAHSQLFTVGRLCLDCCPLPNKASLTKAESSLTCGIHMNI